MGANYWTNDDGLVVRFGGVKDQDVNIGTSPQTAGVVQELVLPITGTELETSVPTNISNGAHIPANSLINSATLYVETAFASGGSATLTIGTYQADGTAIDADGIDATIALTAIDADDDEITCDGAQVGATVSQAAYVAAIYGTAAFTAGEARLVIEYIVQ